MFITLTTLEGKEIPVNKNAVMFATEEGHPIRTYITFMNGQKFAVRESLGDVRLMLTKG